MARPLDMNEEFRKVFEEIHQFKHASPPVPLPALVTPPDHLSLPDAYTAYERFAETSSTPLDLNNPDHQQALMVNYYSYAGVDDFTGWESQHRMRYLENKVDKTAWKRHTASAGEVLRPLAGYLPDRLEPMANVAMNVAQDWGKVDRATVDKLILTKEDASQALAYGPEVYDPGVYDIIFAKAVTLGMQEIQADHRFTAKQVRDMKGQLEKLNINVSSLSKAEQNRTYQSYVQMKTLVKAQQETNTLLKGYGIQATQLRSQTLTEVRELTARFDAQIKRQEKQERVQSSYQFFSELGAIGTNVRQPELVQISVAGSALVKLGENLDKVTNGAIPFLSGAMGSIANLTPYGGIISAAVTLGSMFFGKKKKNQPDPTAQALAVIQRQLQGISTQLNDLQNALGHLEGMTYEGFLQSFENDKRMLTTVTHNFEYTINALNQGFDRIEGGITSMHKDLQALGLYNLISSLSDAVGLVEMEGGPARPDTVRETLEVWLSSQAQLEPLTQTVRDGMSRHFPQGSFEPGRVISTLRNANPVHHLGYLQDLEAHLLEKDPGERVPNPYVWQKAADAYTELFSQAYKNTTVFGNLPAKKESFVRPAKNAIGFMEGTRNFTLFDKLYTDYEEAFQPVVEFAQQSFAKGVVKSPADGNPLFHDLRKSAAEHIAGFNELLPLDPYVYSQGTTYAISPIAKYYEDADRSHYWPGKIFVLAEKLGFGRLTFDFDVKKEQVYFTDQVKGGIKKRISGQLEVPVLYIKSFFTTDRDDKTFQSYLEKRSNNASIDVIIRISVGGLVFTNDQRLKVGLYSSGVVDEGVGVQPSSHALSRSAPDFESSYHQKSGACAYSGYIRSYLEEKNAEKAQSLLSHARQGVAHTLLDSATPEGRVLKGLLEKLDAASLSLTSFASIAGIPLPAQWHVHTEDSIKQALMATQDTGEITPLERIVSVESADLYHKAKTAHLQEVTMAMGNSSYISHNPIENALQYYIHYFEVMTEMVRKQQEGKEVFEVASPVPASASDAYTLSTMQQSLQECETPLSVKYAPMINMINEEGLAALDNALLCDIDRKRTSLIVDLLFAGAYACKDPLRVIEIADRYLAGIEDGRLEKKLKDFKEHHHITHTLPPYQDQQNAGAPLGKAFPKEDVAQGMMAKLATAAIAASGSLWQEARSHGRAWWEGAVQAAALSSAEEQAENAIPKKPAEEEIPLQGRPVSNSLDLDAAITTLTFLGVKLTQYVRGDYRVLGQEERSEQQKKYQETLQEMKKELLSYSSSPIHNRPEYKAFRSQWKHVAKEVKALFAEENSITQQDIAALTKACQKTREYAAYVQALALQHEKEKPYMEGWFARLEREMKTLTNALKHIECPEALLEGESLFIWQLEKESIATLLGRTKSQVQKVQKLNTIRSEEYAVFSRQLEEMKECCERLKIGGTPIGRATETLEKLLLDEQQKVPVLPTVRYSALYSATPQREGRQC